MDVMFVLIYLGVCVHISTDQTKQFLRKASHQRRETTGHRWKCDRKKNSNLFLFIDAEVKTRVGEKRRVTVQYAV